MIKNNKLIISFLIMLTVLISLFFSFSCINPDMSFSKIPVSWSKNSKSFVFEKNTSIKSLDTYTGELWSYNIKRRTQTMLLKRPGYLLIRPVISPDNKKIAFIKIKKEVLEDTEEESKNTKTHIVLEIINKNTLNTLYEINMDIDSYSESGFYIFDIVWGNKNKNILLKITNVNYDRRIILINLDTLKKKNFETKVEKKEIIMDPYFSQNDKYLYYSYFKDNKLILYKYNIKDDNKEKIKMFLFNNNEIDDNVLLLMNQAGYIDNCKYFIFNYNNNVILYDIKIDKVKKIFTFKEEADCFYIPSTDGKYVLYYYEDEILDKQNLIISKLNSKKMYRLCYFDFDKIVYTTLSWSPNNKYIAFKINSNDEIPEKGIFGIFEKNKKYANIINYEDLTESMNEFELQYRFAEMLNKIGFYKLSNKTLRKYHVDKFTDTMVSDLFKLKYNNYMKNYMLIKAGNLIKKAQINEKINKQLLQDSENEINEILTIRKKLHKQQKSIFVKSLNGKISNKERIEIYINEIADGYLQINDYSNYNKSLKKAFKMLKKLPDNVENKKIKEKYNESLEKTIRELDILF